MDLGEIITIIIIFSCIIMFVICLLIDIKNRKFVSVNSEKIKTLLSLNSTIYFKMLKQKYYNHQECTSKKQLDNLSIDEYLIALIDLNEDFYRNIIESIDQNIDTYNKYINQVKKIESTVNEEFCKNIKFKYAKFIKYENSVFESKILHKPQTEVIVSCKASYTSPAGRNHYWKECSYTCSELKKFFYHTIMLKEQRQTRQYQIKLERSKLTDSLRYDILKRDNFRCQICGSTAQDGVKLHVDHIIPISKNGKTIYSNLRTLCDRCNIGKSDKI